LGLVEGNITAIGFIVLYLGLGGVIDSLRSGTFPGSTMGATVNPSQQSVSVYQQGSGTIKGGVVYILILPKLIEYLSMSLSQ